MIRSSYNTVQIFKVSCKTSMLKGISERNDYSSNWGHSCDVCHAAPCTLYCQTDSTYLCQSCDECIHEANPFAFKHERIWICTACENAPATFTCQADAANLCADCDSEIHLANPLARRHIRVPISPPPGIVPGSSFTYLDKLQSPLQYEAMANKSIQELEEDETISWLLLDLDNSDNQTNGGFSYAEDVDQYLDLIEYNSCTEYQSQDQNEQLSSVLQGDIGSDGVVPDQSFESKDQQGHHQHRNTFVDSWYEASKADFANSTTANCQKVPVSFMNAGYLLTTSNIPNPYPRFSNEPNNLLPTSSLLMPLHISPTNREASVLRYREKRKSRKFDKKIRYATRKANAESRPRVKGRFARKTEMEFEMDQLFTAEDCGYGIVPSYQVK